MKIWAGTRTVHLERRLVDNSNASNDHISHDASSRADGSALILSSHTPTASMSATDSMPTKSILPLSARWRSDPSCVDCSTTTTKVKLAAAQSSPRSSSSSCSTSATSSFASSSYSALSPCQNMQLPLPLPPSPPPLSTTLPSPMATTTTTTPTTTTTTTTGWESTPFRRRTIPTQRRWVSLRIRATKTPGTTKQSTLKSTIHNYNNNNNIHLYSLVSQNMEIDATEESSVSMTTLGIGTYPLVFQEPWRVEHILPQGAPNECDWWVVPDGDQGPRDSKEAIDMLLDDGGYESINDHDNKGGEETSGSGTVRVSKTSSVSTTRCSDAVSTAIPSLLVNETETLDFLNPQYQHGPPLVFRNVGLETWLQVQHAWRSAGRSNPAARLASCSSSVDGNSKNNTSNDNTSSDTSPEQSPSRADGHHHHHLHDQVTTTTTLSNNPSQAGMVALPVANVQLSSPMSSSPSAKPFWTSMRKKRSTPSSPTTTTAAAKTKTTTGISSPWTRSTSTSTSAANSTSLTTSANAAGATATTPTTASMTWSRREQKRHKRRTALWKQAILGESRQQQQQQQYEFVPPIPLQQIIATYVELWNQTGGMEE